MADTEYPLILLPLKAAKSGYTSKKQGRGGKVFPKRERQVHGLRIKEKFNNIFSNQDASKVAAFRDRGGMYIQFRGTEGYDLATKSLENITSNIRLLNVTETKGEQENTTVKATVFVPFGQETYFINKINSYLENDTIKGNPKNKSLINSIDGLSYALIEALWTDHPDLLPAEDDIWCELWLRTSMNSKEETFTDIKNTCRELDIVMGEGRIDFPERIVIPVKANKAKLQRILEISPFLAEIRRLADTAHYWLELNNKDQADWVSDLLDRINIEESTVSVLILDTGINRGHRLLEDIIDPKSLFTVNPQWGVNDHNKHGTLMAGTVAYGDLLELLSHNLPLAIGLKVESGKILPPNGENARELYGFYTSQLISQAEIQNTDRNRIICMAVSVDDNYDGKPSSWSGEIDNVTSGANDDQKRLVILSAGNIQLDPNYHYTHTNAASRIESPGQSWNALTVGSMTRKAIITDPKLNGYEPIAPSGGISPFSKTSILWDKKWPIKPEVVFEGGNSAVDDLGPFFTEPDDLSLISTYFQPATSQFALFNMTSASTALASNIAAKIAHNYPSFWPETIRGLMVHSADWTDTMKKQFLGNKKDRGAYLNLLRACGYGEPNFNKAIGCLKNSMTMVMQETMQPFEKKKTKDIHYHTLPWPKEMLLGLGATPVKLRITLSYFIEPGPGEIGWSDRYRYPSHGLRFDINNPTVISHDKFKKRINKQAKSEEEASKNDASRWLIGQNRDKGSIHSDIIETTAANIATCDLVAVFPTIGWWRERAHLGRSNKSCRYSLIISLETPEEDVDIYNAIKTEIENRIAVAVTA